MSIGTGGDVVAVYFNERSSAGIIYLIPFVLISVLGRVNSRYAMKKVLCYSHETNI